MNEILEDVDTVEEKYKDLCWAVNCMITQTENLEKYVYCMSYNESYFGEPIGLVKRTTHELRHIIDNMKKNKLI